MILSHKYKFAFCHIPKTGGSSITHSMKEMCGYYTSNIKSIPTSECCIFKNSIEYRNSEDLFQHAEYGDLKKYLEDIGKNIDDYFVFTFVRNPWDRYVSSYEYGKRAYIKCYKNDWGKPAYDNDFEGWIKNIPYSGQRNYIKDFPFNYIGKMENMEYELENIRQILQTRTANVKLNKVKPIVINANPHADYRSYYTEETKNLVAERSYKIINNFNYEF